MPVSSLSQLSFINLGALTTTYTPPPACATEVARVAIARTSLPHDIAWFEDCDGPSFGTFGSCLPYGADRDEDMLAREEARQSSAVYYHSPGYQCPESWTTAGVAARAEGGDLSWTGIFGTTRAINLTTTVDMVYPTTNPVPNILMEALEPQETAVICCPSGFTANDGIGCHRTLPLNAYTAPSVCKVTAAWGMSYSHVTYTYNGEEVDGIMETQTVDSAIYATMTAEPPTNPQFGVAATYMPAVTLVYVASGGNATSTSTSTATATATPTRGGSASSASGTPSTTETSAGEGESSADSTASTAVSTDTDVEATTTDAESTTAITTVTDASTTVESGEADAVESAEPEFTLDPEGAAAVPSRAMTAVWGVTGIASVFLLAL
ncbi:hypothetical protein S40293_04894 [Stachybotrys chartarum IBT 40293]|nr:hypothetical protein S40293_04894 [Stachybotrys chartarum IBT 40293]KFA81783.1 hypothetical protein S40288_06992 [Stachybotrys chartarum IBT 40288]